MLVVHRVGMNIITEEHLNEGHLRTKGSDPYLEVLYWEMFYKQPYIAILIYLHDYDMKPLCLRLENSQKQHCSSNMGQPNKYLAIKS